jgi:hypothetical protein
MNEWSSEKPLTDEAKNGALTEEGLKAVGKMQDVLRGASAETVYHAFQTREALADLFDEHGLPGEELVQIYDFEALKKQQFGRWQMDLEDEYAPVDLPVRDPLKNNDPQ